jgi:SAM-dependent methyltransferase
VNVPFLTGVLGVQAMPRIADELKIENRLPPERMLYGLTRDEIVGIVQRYDDVVTGLVTDGKISWWDVYASSDVGAERLALVEDIRVQEWDSVLDVGCGKGYTTVALAQYTGCVVGLDLMNGYGRRGWWSNFRVAIDALGLRNRTFGARASASAIPYRDGAFTLTVSAHALRNFSDRDVIVETLMEMKRVTMEGGRVVVAECLPVANHVSQRAHLDMFTLRTRLIKNENPYFTENDVVALFQVAGLEPMETRVVEYPYAATPPLFVPDFEGVEQADRESLESEYIVAVENIKVHGEVSPPVLIVTSIV